jgi:hypothetical protein
MHDEAGHSIRTGFLVSPGRRKALPGGAALVTAPLSALLPAVPAAAHHGWDTSDTRRAYYVAGIVTSVRWGNPHSVVALRV